MTPWHTTLRCTGNCSKRKISRKEKTKGNPRKISVWKLNLCCDYVWQLVLWLIFFFRGNPPPMGCVPGPIAWFAVYPVARGSNLSLLTNLASLPPPSVITWTLLNQLKRCVSMMYSHVLSCSFLFTASLRSFRCPNAVFNVVQCNTSWFPVISKILDNHLSRCLKYFVYRTPSGSGRGLHLPLIAPGWGLHFPLHRRGSGHHQ